MAGFYRDVVAALTAADCYKVRQGRGDHEVWYSPIVDRNIILDCGCKSRHTANETLKQAGLPKAF